MLEINTYYSGSTGNLYMIDNGEHRLLIEAGVPIKKIQQSLNYQLNKLSGALISHSHLDHCKAVPDLIKKGVDCYLSKETIESLKLKSHRLIEIKPKTPFDIQSYKVLPFTTQHDCPGSLGFLIQSGEDKLLFATDTFYLKYKFNGLTHIMVEANYSLDTLSPELPEIVKHRLFKSHFSLENLVKFFQANDLSKVEEIILIHMSSKNSDEEYLKKTIQGITGKMVRTA